MRITKPRNWHLFTDQQKHDWEQFEYPKLLEQAKQAEKEFAAFMNREVVTVCLDCGKKYDTKNKSTFGIWNGNCDICGKKDVPCADAAHDFGIYSNPEGKAKDKLQDLL